MVSGATGLGDGDGVGDAAGELVAWLTGFWSEAAGAWAHAVESNTRPTAATVQFRDTGFAGRSL